MNTWTLPEALLAHMLAEADLKPATGSQLRSLNPARGDQGNPAVENAPALREGLACLARPRTILGTALYGPPDPPEYSWFFGGDGQPSYAFHEIGGDGDHTVVWPIDGHLVVHTSRSILSSEVPPARCGVTLLLSRREFETLAVLLDLFQEKSLSGMMHRRLSGPVGFTDKELVACCQRGGMSSDLRWMVPRASMFAPIELEFSADSIRHGLRSLLDKGLLFHREGLFGLSADLAEACSFLSVCDGVVAMSSRRRQGRASWDLTHFAGYQGMEGSLWLFEFMDISAGEFEVQINCIGENDLYERLKACVPRPEQSRCPDCGNPQRPAARFCSNCGKVLN